MVDLTPYSGSISAALEVTPATTCSDPRGAFIQELTLRGYQAPKALRLGEIERIDGPDDRRGKKAGWYVYHEIESSDGDGSIIGFAKYGSWKLGEENSWCSKSDQQMSGSERTNYHKAREEMRLKHEQETIKKHEEAAKLAYAVWEGAKPANDDHGYLKSKGVKATKGLKLSNDGNLIIPAAIDNKIVSLQYVKPKGDFVINGDPIGNKKFLTGGKQKGAWFVIEGKTDTVYIAEGYATAASIHEATGKTCYIAFNAGNLYEVSNHVKSKHENSRIIIAGDDDTGTAGNPGRTKAEQAASGLGLECIFPTGFVDFNDQHQAQGIGAIKRLLNPKKGAYKGKKKVKDRAIERPCGVLGDISDYYNATSGNEQFHFSIQTALSVCSLILGRSYKTSLENFTPLYLLNVAKSGTGKEHAKTVAEKVLYKCGYGHFIAGDGYTSAGAVFSTLLATPKHISIIDEFGRYLEAGKEMGRGNQHQREANTKLMEAISRTHSVMRPPSYSAMTLKKEAADELKNRYVHNPSITLLTMTTPSTLFKSLDMGAIKDGFINRFIIAISDAERAVRQHKPPVDVPESIISWARMISARNNKPHLSNEPAIPITLEFSNEAYQMQMDFQQYTNVDLPNKLDEFGMAELSGRSNEMAMKVSLIHALSRNANAQIIEAEDMKWAINYIKTCLDATVSALKVTISHSGYEASKKEILESIRECGEGGITWSDMQKSPPYSQHKQRDLRDILNSLKDADLISDEAYSNGGKGRPTTKWIALK